VRRVKDAQLKKLATIKRPETQLKAFYIFLFYAKLMGNKLKSNRAEFAKFGAYFENALAPFLHSLEGERKTRFMVGSILAVALTPVGLFLALYFGVVHDGGDSRAFHFAYSIPMMGYCLAMFKLRKKTKLHLTEGISKFLGWQHSSREDSKALTRLLYDFDVLPKHSIIHTDDVLRGTHELWPFALREITLSKMEGWGNNRRAVTVFQGLILTFGVNSTMTGEAIITNSDIYGHPRNRPAIRHEGVINNASERITIRASSEAIIRTIMCTRFQRALIELDTKMPNRYVSCVLYGNELHIPISSNNLFEIDWLFEAMDTPHRVQKILDDFSYVLELLDIFLKPRTCSATGISKVPEFRKF